MFCISIKGNSNKRILSICTMSKILEMYKMFLHITYIFQFYKSNIGKKIMIYTYRCTYLCNFVFCLVYIGSAQISDILTGIECRLKQTVYQSIIKVEIYTSHKSISFSLAFVEKVYSISIFVCR